MFTEVTLILSRYASCTSPSTPSKCPNNDAFNFFLSTLENQIPLLQNLPLPTATTINIINTSRAGMTHARTAHERRTEIANLDGNTRIASGIASANTNTFTSSINNTTRTIITTLTNKTNNITSTTTNTTRICARTCAN